MSYPGEISDCNKGPSKGGLAIKELRKISTAMGINIRKSTGQLKLKAELCQEIEQLLTGEKKTTKTSKIKIEKVVAVPPKTSPSSANPNLSAIFLQTIPGVKINKAEQATPVLGDLQQLNTWLALKGQIPDYKSIRNPYQNKLFQLISVEQYDSIMKRLAEQVYFKYHEQQTSWLNGNKPDIDINNDPVFVQKVAVPKGSKIILIGDLHSSMTSMINILSNIHQEAFANNFKLKDDYYIVFLGDIVDRGPYGVELISLVSLLQINNPEHVFLINGNHEDYEIYSFYGYGDEVKGQFEIEQVITKTHFLHYLPSAIFLEIIGSGSDPGKITYQFCHGAMTEKNDEKAAIKNLLANNEKGVMFSFLNNYQIKNGNRGGTDNLKWGDMSLKDGLNLSPRDHYQGKVLEYGKDEISKYLKELGLKAIISGHQDASNLTFLTEHEIDLNTSQKYEQDYRYDLYRPKGYASLKTGQNYDYIPGVDFIAINTSSAYMSKGNDQALKYDCYLKLT